MNVQVSQDMHLKAFDWLEEHLEEKIYRFEIDDIIGMVEQVVMQ